MARLRSGGVALHYECHGAGNPVVLLHGFTSSFAGTWLRAGWVELLTEHGHAVVGLDFPGHGESEPAYDPERCRPERLAGDVLGLLDHLVVPRAASRGFSLGAGVALRIAITAPERVTRLVVGGIGDAAVKALHEPDELARLRAGFATPCAGDVADPAARRIRRNAELAGNDVRALAPYLAGGGWPGALDGLLPVSAPTLLYVAEEDEYMRQTATIEGWLSHARVVRLAGQGHHDAGRNERLREEVLAFLAAQPRVQ